MIILYRPITIIKEENEISVKPNSREAILKTAAQLFFTQGYHATGLNQIIQDSKCPKGSLYYYFPSGKEELALECINSIKKIVLDKWKEHFGYKQNAADAIQSFIEALADDAVRSDFEGFMPFNFWMAAETSPISDKLRKTCQTVFAEWQSIIADHLVLGGIPADKAKEKAVVIVSLLEGALILTLTNKDKETLLTVSSYIPCIVNN
ncbi:TetR/AcrR family transcriptional regulator [Paenibacillus sp. 1_12]|uniref:TetR/AcrR family transcriptional regulator n=1 Tax=Paenibacillus sp. 1_12 TaxID=1566278 RepID=UPI0035292BE3